MLKSAYRQPAMKPSTPMNLALEYLNALRAVSTTQNKARNLIRISNKVAAQDDEYRVSDRVAE
jgi:hypothetical protein